MKVKILAKNGLKIVNLNRRKAIHERCLNCSCWIPNEVTNCSFTDCPLYSYRTGKGKQNPNERKKAIRDYCLWCMVGQHSEIRKCVSHHCPLFAYRMKNIDRSAETVSMAENEHIEPVFEGKINQRSIG